MLIPAPMGAVPPTGLFLPIGLARPPIMGDPIAADMGVFMLLPLGKPNPEAPVLLNPARSPTLNPAE